MFLLRWTRRRISMSFLGITDGDKMIAMCAVNKGSSVACCMIFVRLPAYDFWLFQKPVSPEVSSGSYFCSPQNTKVGQYFSLKWHYNVLNEYIWFEVLSFPSLMFLFLTHVSCRLVTILLWLYLSKLWLLTVFSLLRADVLLTSKLYDSLLLTSQLYGHLHLVLSPCILLRLILYDCNCIFVLSTRLKLNCIGLSICS